SKAPLNLPIPDIAPIRPPLGLVPPIPPKLHRSLQSGTHPTRGPGPVMPHAEQQGPDPPPGTPGPEAPGPLGLGPLAPGPLGLGPLGPDVGHPVPLRPGHPPVVRRAGRVPFRGRGRGRHALTSRQAR
ncbi:hypothetical protein AB0F16_19195, partial [Streptomyces tanashiensis]